VCFCIQIAWQIDFTQVKVGFATANTKAAAVVTVGCWNERTGRLLTIQSWCEKNAFIY
jgi:hypothetical protein